MRTIEDLKSEYKEQVKGGNLSFLNENNIEFVKVERFIGEDTMDSRTAASIKNKLRKMGFVKNIHGIGVYRRGEIFELPSTNFYRWIYPEMDEKVFEQIDKYHNIMNY